MGKTVPHFKDWFNKTVIYKEMVSRDGAEIVYASSGESIGCYISGHTKMVINDKGEEVVSTKQIYIDGDDYTIIHDSLFEIDSVNRPVKSIEEFYDEDGNTDLIVVYL